MDDAAPAARGNCYNCHKPEALCICGSVPIVENRTEIIILQHPRERFHALNTARIARLGLRRVAVHVAFRESDRSKRVHLPLSLPPGTGLLYPRPDAVVLTPQALKAHDAPRHLVVLDGTWSQAHRLYQDNPYLHCLPHYRLDPAVPSRYRIRREPKPHCVSTIESIAMALRVLEPDLANVNSLVAALDHMIDAQVHHRPKGVSEPREKKPRPERESHRIPMQMVEHPERIVLVYGETVQLSQRSDPSAPELLQWTAVRLVDDDAFDAIVQPARPASDGMHMRRLELGDDALSDADTLDNVVRRFHAFLREGDVLAAWHPSTLKLLPQLRCEPRRALMLKGAYCNLRGGRCGNLEDVLARESLVSDQVPVRGRAGSRLGNARAIARYLVTEAKGR